MDDLETKLERVTTDLAKLRIELAERRPVEQIVKYLLYFWLTISILLGFFGWKQISDLDEQIKNAVASQFPEDSNNYRNYKKLLADTELLYADFEELTANYKQRVDDLKYADVVAGDFDIEGQVQAIVRESDVEDNTRDFSWRTRAITVLERFRNALANKTFPATFVFNAAQVCRQLQQFQLAEEMTMAAFRKDPSAPIRALKLASEVANKTGDDRDRAYGELVSMVDTLDYEVSPQIVLAEAWNAAESIRRYQPLVEALSRLTTEKKKNVPSYAYLIQAEAMLRIGYPGVRDDAIEVIRAGYSMFREESALSQWNGPFVREYLSLLRVVEDSREIKVSPLEDIEGEIDLLRQLLEQSGGGDHR